MTTRIKVNADKTFDFSVHTPPTSYLIKQAIGLEKGSARPNDVQVGQISLKHIYHIAQIKAQDPNLSGVELESVASRICAQAKGMGIQVVA